MATAKTRIRTETLETDTGYRIELPPPIRPSKKELERRRQLESEVMRLREQIGPIGIRVDQLIHEARDEDDA